MSFEWGDQSKSVEVGHQFCPTSALVLAGEHAGQSIDYEGQKDIFLYKKYEFPISIDPSSPGVSMEIFHYKLFTFSYEGGKRYFYVPSHWTEKERARKVMDHIEILVSRQKLF